VGSTVLARLGKLLGVVKNQQQMVKECNGSGMRL
jgi:hypothetical protein